MLFEGYRNCYTRSFIEQQHIDRMQERNAAAAAAADDEEGAMPESHPALLTVGGDAVLRFWVEVTLRPLLGSDGCGKQRLQPSRHMTGLHPTALPDRGSGGPFSYLCPRVARTHLIGVSSTQGCTAGLSFLLHARHRTASRVFAHAAAGGPAAGVLGHARPVASAR